MKASELTGRSFFTGLIYGEAGVGKTVLASQFPGPIEYWDWDTKIDSAVSYLPTIGKAEQLENIDVYQFAKLTPRERIPAWKKRMTLISDAVITGKPLPFKTLVLDTITQFSYYYMEDFLYSQTGIKRPSPGQFAQSDYGMFANDMTRHMSNLLVLDANVVVLGHVDVVKDEITGVIERRPLVKGKALAPTFASWFKEVYAARVLSDGKRVLQTQPGGGYVIRSQRNLAKEIPMSIGEILK